MVTTTKIEVIDKDKTTEEQVVGTIQIPAIHFGGKSLGMIVISLKEEGIGILCKTLTKEEYGNFKPSPKVLDYKPEAMMQFKTKESLKEIGEYLIRLSEQWKE